METDRQRAEGGTEGGKEGERERERERESERELAGGLQRKTWKAISSRA